MFVFSSSIFSMLLHICPTMFIIWYYHLNRLWYHPNSFMVNSVVILNFTGTTTCIILISRVVYLVVYYPKYIHIYIYILSNAANVGNVTLRSIFPIDFSILSTQYPIRTWVKPLDWMKKKKKIAQNKKNLRAEGYNNNGNEEDEEETEKNPPNANIIRTQFSSRVGCEKLAQREYDKRAIEDAFFPAFPATYV